MWFGKKKNEKFDVEKNEKFDVEKNEKLMWGKKMNILPHKIFCPKC